MKNEFTLRVQNTQLNESLNKDLKDYLKFDLNVAEFFAHFDRVIEQKREKKVTSLI